MNKKALIERIAAQARLTQRQSDEALSALIEAIIYSLSIEQDVFIAGFGRFYVSAVPARQGRNPQTGQAMLIEARRRPQFKPAAQLKNTVAAALRSSK